MTVSEVNSFCHLIYNSALTSSLATRKLFHQLTNTTTITRPNELHAIRRLLRRLLDSSEGYDKQFRLCVSTCPWCEQDLTRHHVYSMTGDFILSSAYGITPTSADEPYIQRSNKLVILVSETNQRDAYIG